MSMTITRRTLLAATIGTGGMAMASVVSTTYVSDSDLLQMTLHRLVGELEMTEADWTSFTADFKTIFPTFTGLRADLMSLLELSGTISMFSETLPTVADKIESFERALLTNFLMSTDYLQASKAPKPLRVSYYGVQKACANPFAEFV